jgi:hypothetical protein
VRKWKVLHRRRPAWLAGEVERDRDERVRLSPFAPLAPDEAHYHGDYAGFVVSVIPAERSFSAGDLADPNRAVVELELTDSELAVLRRRESRIVAGRLEPVTFDQRWGAIAPVLRRNFEDLEAAEKAEAETREGDLATQQGTDAWRFAELVALNRAFIAPNVVHSGAGLYEVGPGKTYSTVQSALDQLWTDQGGATFTEIQYIRIFADTYVEDVTANAGFVMDATNGYLLVIEGDPTDDRANIIIQPPAGDTYGIKVSDQAEIRHLTIDGVNLNGSWEYGINAASGRLCRVSDCAVTVTYGFCYLSTTTTSYLEDCTFTMNGNRYCAQNAYECIARRCVFVGNGGNKTQCIGLNVNGYGVTAEACTFRDCLRGVVWGGTGNDNVSGKLDVRNCSFYNVGEAVRVHARPAHVFYANLINCAAKGVDYVIRTQVWPDETTEGGIHGPWTLRNNCLDYDVAFAWNDADTKTLAQFAAFDKVDSAGDKDATDPLFTDPANGDFSLASGSPCRHAGCGAGVTSDRLGFELDPHHPDIGAVGTGTIEAPGEPSAAITGVSGATVTLAVSGDEGTVHHAELVSARTGAFEDDDSREGDGTLSLVASDVAARYFVVVWSDNAAGRSEPAAPLEVYLPEGESPFDEVRVALVARLSSHAGLQDVLGTDDLGGVPVYAARPGMPRRVPSVVYTLEGTPDSVLDRAGRWHMKLIAEAWGGSPGVNDAIVGAMDEVLSREPFDCTSWSVKRIVRTGDGTDWTDDGRTEFRRTEWALVVDKLGS